MKLKEILNLNENRFYVDFSKLHNSYGIRDTKTITYNPDTRKNEPAFLKYSPWDVSKQKIEKIANQLNKNPSLIKKYGGTYFGKMYEK